MREKLCEELCEICGELFSPEYPRPLREYSGKICAFCLEKYAAY